MAALFERVAFKSDEVTNGVKVMAHAARIATQRRTPAIHTPNLAFMPISLSRFLVRSKKHANGAKYLMCDARRKYSAVRSSLAVKASDRFACQRTARFGALTDGFDSFRSVDAKVSPADADTPS